MDKFFSAKFTDFNGNNIKLDTLTSGLKSVDVIVFETVVGGVVSRVYEDGKASQYYSSQVLNIRAESVSSKSYGWIALFMIILIFLILVLIMCVSKSIPYKSS